MRELLSNYAYFVIPLISWVVAQFTKLLIKGFGERNWNWRYLYRSGGMPSAHTTIVVSLCTVLAYRIGTHSPEFGISCIFAAITMYDAVNVRHAVGEHAIALRAIIPKVFSDHKTNPVIHQSFGHTPNEVLAGLVVGIIVPLVVFAVT